VTFDLDAVQRESDKTPFEFTFGGDAYTLPPSIDMLAAASLARGDLYGGLSRLLGAGQLERMLASDAVLDEQKLMVLLEEYGKHLGTPLGESLASTGS